MKQPKNNEIDSLLRALAGHEQSAPSDLAENVRGAHLDADELSSYAERAVPPSTRARYTAHLVDCDHCRKIVTQLSLAAGAPIIEHPSAGQPGTSGWRRTLAALFAPAVLRYAMPAVLLVFVGLAFFAWRQQRGESLLARNNETELSRQAHLDSGAGTPTSSPIDQLATKQQNAAPSVSTRTATTTDKAGERQQKNTEEQASASSATNEQKEAAKKESAAVAQPTYAKEPPPAPKPTNSVMAKDSSRPAGGNVEVQEATARKREADKSSADANAGATVAAKAPAANRDDDGRKAKALSAARAAEDRRDEAAETRAVAGRRFQRRNGVWVDTAFNSSQSLTTVTRGSEQFRALIADEPEIGTIAKQLSGEVVIVWKGRAYHIH